MENGEQMFVCECVIAWAEILAITNLTFTKHERQRTIIDILRSGPHR